jgi:hypothetical protein
VKPRTGGPPLSTSIHLRVSARDYDALYAQAQQARTTIPDLIRRTLDRRRAPAKPVPVPNLAWREP